MSKDAGFKLRLAASSLFAIITAMLAFGILIHYNPWHSGLLNLLSLAGLLALAALAAIKFNFSWRQIQSFIKREKLAIIAAVFCLGFFAAGAASTTQSWHVSKTKGQAITYDEVALLPIGYAYVQNGQYFLGPEHPPLIKIISSLPFYLMHVKQPPAPLPKDVLVQTYSEFAWGKTFLFDSGNNTEKLIFAARMTDLFASTVLIFALFLTIAYLWSRRAGLMTVVLITTSQFLIAHGSLSLFDFISGILTILALCWFAGWLSAFGNKKPAKLKLALAAVFLALALLAKFSTILLGPIIVVVGGLYLLLNWADLKNRRLRFIGGIVAICAVALALIVIFYAPLVRNMSSGDLSRQLAMSYDTKRLPVAGLNLLKDTAKAGILGRAFAEYANGVSWVNNRLYQGAGGVYFVGHFYGNQGAGPSYFPILYLAKLQITYHLLSLVALLGGLWLIFKERWAGTKKRLIANPMVLAVLLYCFIFATIAIFSTLQIGLRHFMPVIPGLMVLTAIGLDHLIKKVRPSRGLLWLTAGVFSVFLAGSVVRSYPYYLSYYNGFAGGTGNGYKIAVDSNYDWGQDLKRLGAWEQQNHVSNLHFDLFVDPWLPISYYLGDGVQSYNVATDPPLPAGSYLAVSANQYELNTHLGIPTSKKYSQFDKDQVARVGTSIFIYKIPAHIQQN